MHRAGFTRFAGGVWTGGRHVARQLIGAPAATLPALGAATGIRDDRIVRAGTEVCIDGYPRSGNTWTVRAFRQWNPNASVAHHLHVPGQIRAAVRRGLPTGVVVRPPQDVVVSMIVWTGGQLPARVGLWGYTRFHRQILSLAPEIVLCRFDEVIEDPGRMVEALNERFDTSFHRGANDEAFRETLGSDLRAMSADLNTDPDRQAAVPVPERRELKRQAAESVAGHPWLPRAQAAYQELLSAARE